MNLSNENTSKKFLEDLALNKPKQNKKSLKKRQSSIL